MKCKSDKKKGRILLAARELFSAMGFGKTTLDDIAVSVGMKKTSLYHYFRNKEELFLHAFEEEWQNNTRHFQEAVALIESPRERILAYLKANLQYHQEVVQKHKLTVKALLETRDLLPEHFEDMKDRQAIFLSSIIDEGIQNESFRPCNAKAVARTLMRVKDAFMTEAMRKAMAPGQRADFDHIEEEVISASGLILDGIIQYKQAGLNNL